MKKILFLFVSLGLITGCGLSTKPPIITQITPQTPLTISVPKDFRKNSHETDNNQEQNIALKELLRNVTFGSKYHYIESQFDQYGIARIKGIQSSISGSDLTVMDLNGEKYNTGRKYFSFVKYDIRVSEQQFSDKTIYVLQPYQRTETQNSGPLFIPYRVPIFEYNDLMNYLMDVNFYVDFDFTSQYSVDSIRANFQRIMQDTFEKDKFTAKVDNCTIIVTPNFYPYQNGSKTIGTASVHCDNTSNQIDLGTLKTSVNNFLKNIVNN